MLTIIDIAEITGLSKRTIERKGFLENYYDRMQITSKVGRPTKLYKSEILELLMPGSETKALAGKTSEVYKLRKNRGDKNLPRMPKNWQMSQRIDLENHIISGTRKLYLVQALKRNVEDCCRQICMDFIREKGLPGGFTDPEDMVRYYYFKRIMRKDGNNIGAFWRERWDELWVYENDKRKFNSMMPMNKYDLPELFKSIGLVGSGFGAGQLWVMDATQLDMWVRVSGKVQTINFYMIMDVLTGFPIALEPIDGETVEGAISAVIQAVEKFGVPKWGIILDNGKAFKSRAFRGFVKSLYKASELEEIAASDWHRQIFGGQTEPCKYPLPKMPDYFGKAKLERSFDEFNRQFPTKFYPKNILPSRESRAVSYELGSTPTQALKTAPDFDEVWVKFLDWIYTDEQGYLTKLKSNFYALGKELGLLPNIKNMWKYYGGENLTFTSLPDKNIPYLIYWRASKLDKHIITVKSYGTASVIHNNLMRNYMSDKLSRGLINRKICVLPDPKNEREAYLYLVYDAKWADEKCPEPDTVYYLGKAFDQTINSKDALNNLHKRKSTQNKIVKEFKEESFKVEVPPELQCCEPTPQLNPSKELVTGQVPYELGDIGYEEQEKEFKIFDFQL